MTKQQTFYECRVDSTLSANRFSAVRLVCSNWLLVRCLCFSFLLFLSGSCDSRIRRKVSRDKRSRLLTVYNRRATRTTTARGGEGVDDDDNRFFRRLAPTNGGNSPFVTRRADLQPIVDRRRSSAFELNIKLYSYGVLVPCGSV